MDSLLERIEELERENVGTTNLLYEILNRLDRLESDYVLRSNKLRESNDSILK
jgi:hypothetical protein